MKAAIARVRPALAAKDFGANLNWYTLKDGFIFAQDGKMVAAAPFAHGLNCMVPGAELDQLVNRLPDEIEIIDDTATSNTITLRGGRMRGTIQTQLCNTAPEIVQPDQAWATPPASLV